MILEHDMPWFDEMSVAEKISLIQDLWDRLAAQSDGVEITARQREELDRRLACYRDDPQCTSTWEEIQQRVRTSR